MRTKDLIQQLETMPFDTDALRALADRVGKEPMIGSADDFFPIAEIVARRHSEAKDEDARVALAILLLVTGCQVGVQIANMLLSRNTGRN